MTALERLVDAVESEGEDTSGFLLDLLGEECANRDRATCRETKAFDRAPIASCDVSGS